MQQDQKSWAVKQAFAVVKIAEVCNLKCPYCYFFFGADQSFDKDPKRMPLDVARATAEYLAKGAKEFGYNRIDVSLHGGEPLMVGKRHFVALCETFREVFEGRAELGINMQTNATLVDREWAEIFHRYGVGVGISIDGAEETHNRTRIDKKGRGTYNQTIRGLQLIREYHGDVGALCVIDPEADGAEAYRHMVHTLGLRSIDFLLPLQNWDDFDAERTAKTTRFYEGVMSAWLADNNPQVSIRSLSDPMIAMLSDKGAARRAAYLHSASHAITIRSNGDVCPDDTLTSINPEFRETGFNVRTSTLGDFMRHPLWEELLNSSDAVRSECGDCRWWSICQGGHPDHRYGRDSMFRRKTTYCGTWKSIFSGLEGYVGSAVPVAELDARLGAQR